MLVKYKCDSCGDIKDVNIKDRMREEYCPVCNEVSCKPIPLDISIKTIRYGREQNLNCVNGCCELVTGHASDVNFGNDISRDVVIVYCPVCQYEEDIFTK
jgi:hypothetical protein